MGGGGSKHVHHHHPPPQPSLQERRDNVQAKIDLEHRNHQQALADCQRQQAAFGQELQNMQKAYTDSLKELMDAQAKDSEKANRDLAAIATKLNAQINDIDAEILDLEAEVVRSRTALSEYEGFLDLKTQRAAQHHQRKVEKELALKAKLDELIRAESESVKLTEHSLETLLADKAITNEAVRRFVKISALLITIPKQACDDSEATTRISQFLVTLCDKISSHIEKIRIDLKKINAGPMQVIEWLKANRLDQPKLLEIVENEWLTLDNLAADIQSDAPEFSVLSSRLRNTISEKFIRGVPSKVAVEDIQETLEMVTGNLKPILHWQSEVAKLQKEDFVPAIAAD